MEDVPPPYEIAINREAWKVIAPWIPSSDLCSACLVCRKWYSIFIPFLWGDPASHFGTENDAVYVALTRFNRTLKKARISVRQLTHTLHLPPALSEIYGEPNPRWLRDVLEYLPNLQSLIVSKLPFFDHQSLLALRGTSGHRRPSADGPEHDLPLYGLKLLLAAREPNTTSISLAEAVPLFPQLVYLDLSYTTPARDASVLSAFSTLHDLQVLKLRGVGLRDSEVEVLASTIGLRVRLLDLRENLLTDMAVVSLIQSCFLPPDTQQIGNRLNSPTSSRQVEDWPVGIAPGPELLSLDSLRSEELDQQLLVQLTHPLTGRLALEDIPHKGITHLYISDNNLSVSGLANLLKSTRLHMFDGGSMQSVKKIARVKSSAPQNGYKDVIAVQGAEELIPILGSYARNNLTYLRLNHAVVTAKLPAMEIASTFSTKADSSKLNSTVSELTPPPPTATAELPPEERRLADVPASTSYPVELHSEPEQAYELFTAPPSSKSELPGDCVHFAICPPVGNAPSLSRRWSHNEDAVQGGGAFAPEVVTNGIGEVQDLDQREEEVISQSPGTELASKQTREVVRRSLTLSTRYLEPQVQHLVERPSTASQPHIQPIQSTVSQSCIEMLLSRRPPPVTRGLINRLAPMVTEPVSLTASVAARSLHPSMLPNLRTLVLMDVPVSVPQSSPVIPALIQFICACAEEDALAHLRAQTDYSLPPGRFRHESEMIQARSLFALRLIVLEMATPQTQAKDGLAIMDTSKSWKQSGQRISLLKSSTGDLDSENLWSAAEDDFSFFSEEGEEKDEGGLHAQDREKYFPSAQMDGKVALSPDEARHMTFHRTNTVGSIGGGIARNPPEMNILRRTSTMLRSPWELPLGRDRTNSNSSTDRDSPWRTLFADGSISRSVTTTNPTSPPVPTEAMVDVVTEVAKFRRERKAAYENTLLKLRMAAQRFNHGFSKESEEDHGADVQIASDERDLPFVEGHWKGVIKVVRNAIPKGRTGVVDIYGNYFEKGYVYPWYH